jgi:hypothetical protein
MKKRLKQPFVLIVAGALIALVPLFFVTGFKPEGGFFANLFAIKIWLIPYRFILAIGILFIFVGIKRMADRASGQT